MVEGLLLVHLSSIDPLFPPFVKVLVDLLDILFRHRLDLVIAIIVATVREESLDGGFVLIISREWINTEMPLLTAALTVLISDWRSFVWGNSSFAASSWKMECNTRGEFRMTDQY